MTDDSGPERDVPEEEIEILEVIGLDEDSPAARPRRPRRAGSAQDDAVVVLDDDEARAEGEEERADDDEPPDDDDGDPGAAEAAWSEAQPAAPPLEDPGERAARLAADFEGLRRRVEREREAHERQAAARLIERLLPVLDNFERALGGAQGTPGASFRDGIALIFRQLLDELRKEGLIAVDTVGEPFDPQVHEAVAAEHASELPPHTVVEELQRGYLLHDRLLRPALVKVTLDPDPAGGTAQGSGEP